MINETQLEAEIQSKGLNAPRLTPEHIDSCIKYVEYWVVPNTTSTVCAMVLQNNLLENLLQLLWQTSTKKLARRLHTAMRENRFGL
jgi:hypothetical protein